MKLRQEEVIAMRKLAHEYMEIASLPVQREKMELWKAFNRHGKTRPMVLIDQLPWHELNGDGGRAYPYHSFFCKKQRIRTSRGR